MNAREDWRTLIPELERWAAVRILGPGSLVLTCDGTSRELRLTPHDWDDIETVVCGGDTETAARVVRSAWSRATPEQSYLVYDGQYGVEPSAPDLWVDPGRQAFDDAIESVRRSGGNAGWYAVPPDQA